MKVLEINKLELSTACPEMEEVSARLDELPDRNHIDAINWKDYSYKPDVSFSMAYSDKELLLKYYVAEEYFKAEKTETNQMVCEDSCVEFFVSPEDDGIYYNMEFNGIGTCLMGTGTARKNSTRSDPEIIAGIRRLTSAGKKSFKEKKGRFNWTITIAIPFKAFFHHEVRQLKGKTFRANFYKCGDMLSVPHFVTWNPVGTPKPDYHRPEYFGLLKFV